MVTGKNPTAWMIRCDGEALPCIQHIYSGEVVDETLYAAQWLYLHTLYKQTKAVCLSLIKSYAVSLGKENLTAALSEDIKEKPYVFLTVGFINSVGEYLYKVDTDDVPKLCREVSKLLNEEFLRARYGGMYNTKKDCRDMYFRVSSANMDWNNIMRDSVNNHKSKIDTVTVVYDEESTGRKNCFYEYNGVLCNKLPVDVFTNKPTLK